MRRVNLLVLSIVLATAAIFVAVGASLDAQQNSSGSPVQITTQYALVPISATAAVNVQTTLTIPAPPPGFYNYVCSLHFNASQNGTGTAAVNAVTTSTNFNAWALKFSL